MKLVDALRRSLRHARWYLAWRTYLAMATRRKVHGIKIRAAAPVDEEANRRALDMVEAALHLIAQYDPRRMRRIVRDVEWILITRTTYASAYYERDWKMCVINRSYLTDAGASAAGTAATIVHEATHARLLACGIPYDEPLRPRVEALCYAEGANFARRLPEGDRLAQEILHTQPTASDHWSAERLGRRASDSRQAAYADQLKDLEAAELPGWIMRWLSKLVRTRAARDARRDAPKDTITNCDSPERR